jgi:serine O-acetyltransferase
MSAAEKKFRESKKFRAVTSIVYGFQCIRSILHIFLFTTSPSKPVIEKDIQRWLELEHKDLYQQKLSSWKALVWLLWKQEAYRNLFYYRIKKDYLLFSRIILEAGKFLYAPRNTLFVKADKIGEGFFIQHGYATGIAARSIGKNCWVNQLVVIGYSDEGKAPIIGDNVHISVGAKVLGDVTIGDNSIVGANAVVVKNVPPNCTVVGVPAYIIKRDGKKVHEVL